MIERRKVMGFFSPKNIISYSFTALLLASSVCYGAKKDAKTDAKTSTMLTEFELRPHIEHWENGKSDFVFVEPEGIYAKIDVQKDVDALKVFSFGKPEEKKELAKKIRDNLGDYAPPVLLALSAYDVNTGNIKDGALLFNLAEIRLLIDRLSASADNSLGDVYDLMGYQYFESIQKSLNNKKTVTTFETDVKQSFAEAVDLDKKTPRAYDQRWIYLLGINVYTTSLKSADDKTDIDNDTLVKVADKKEQEKIADTVYKKLEEAYAKAGKANA